MLTFFRNTPLSILLGLTPLVSLPCSAITTVIPETSQNSINATVAQITQIATEAYQQGTLDGEFLIMQQGKTLAHLLSKETLSDFNTTSKQPKHIIRNSFNFYCVALLKALYDASTATTEEAKVAEVKQQCDKPISHFLPAKHPLWNGKMPRWASEVTLYNVLTHRSGLENDQEIQFHTPQESVQAIASIPELPGTYTDSNVEPMLIKQILQTFTKQDLSTYLQEHLFNPLGLTATEVFTRTKESPQIAPAFQYSPLTDPITPLPSPQTKEKVILASHECIVSTFLDLAIWMTALHGNKTVLSPLLYDFLNTPDLDMGTFSISSCIGNCIFLGDAFHNESYNEFYYDFCLVYSPENDIFFGLYSNAYIPHLPSSVWHQPNPLPASELDELDILIFNINTILKFRQLQRGYLFVSHKISNTLSEVDKLEEERDDVLESTETLIEMRIKALAERERLLAERVL
jgi:hypothetical protein